MAEQVFEATIEKRGDWYVGWIDAVPGAFSQGRTMEEAVRLVLDGQQAPTAGHRTGH